MALREQWKIADLTWGRFLVVRQIPAGGFRWEEEYKGHPGPWLSEAPSIDEQRINRVPGLVSHLHRKFAMLRTGAQILAFANKFGWLGCTPTLDMGSYIEEPDVELLKTWQDEATRMAALIALSASIRAGRREELARFVRWSIGTEAVRFEALYYRKHGLLPSATGSSKQESSLRIAGRLAIQGIGGHDELLERWRRDRVLGPAKYFLADQINQRLRGSVSPTTLADGSGIFFQPHSLLATLYVLFALEVNNEDKPVRECERDGCYNQFPRRGEAKRFCSVACKSAVDYEKKKKRGALDAPRLPTPQA